MVIDKVQERFDKHRSNYKSKRSCGRASHVGQVNILTAPLMRHWVECGIGSLSMGDIFQSQSELYIRVAACADIEGNDKIRDGLLDLATQYDTLAKICK